MVEALVTVAADRNRCVRTIRNGRSNPASAKMSSPLFVLNSVRSAGVAVGAEVGRTMRLTEPQLFDFPFIFMTNMGSMELDSSEKKALRSYLLRGGFLMADDFWAYAEWNHIRDQMKQVFPDREPIELSLDHKIFHMVYDLAKLPQVPSIRAWQRGMTYEDWHGPFERGDTTPHFWGYLDDEHRLMALFCHNNDVADGWEREGEDIEYFQEYSLKCSYPFGINIITYAMTH